ncbi:hypothetical protein Leryth_008288 [Lithospermum erythrorhizon]|uniref:Uncharacterized protein n=1 Tax=Lithospermum erythrorhizon TaxID=34254 RepID=A0AAV3RT67_LITER|nr:hypothetical protein Leryth_008288 [Lithospermum erythrorhizon]
MAEEQRLQEPGAGHRLCANNCGFFGSPTTHNLCSKCYNDHCIKEQQMKEAKLAMETTSTSSSRLRNKSADDNVFACPGREQQLELDKSKTPNDLENIVVDKQPETPKVVVAEAIGPNRCATCRKRVGLTGFKCRCGVTFCGTHRYPEQHGCTFDYKVMGREEIAKANPIVKGNKLEKI